MNEQFLYQKVDILKEEAISIDIPEIITKGLSKNEWCIAWGVGLLLIAFVLSFFVKIIALSVTRTSFTYEINYLLHFPLNTVVITAIILLAYGIYTLRK